MWGMAGDFVFRGEAGGEALRGGLEAVFSEAVDAPVRLTFLQVERRVIVFQGRWVGRKSDQVVSGQIPWFDVYGGDRDLSRGGEGAGSGNVADFRNRIGSMIKTTVVVEAEDVPEKISWQYVRGEGEKEQPLGDFRRFLCRQIAERTSMEWSEEIRSVRRLLIERAEGE
jgi:hypothetical protein